MFCSLRLWGPKALLLLCCLPFSLSEAEAQLIRQANTTLALPASLPVATGYSTENALGSLTFSSPVDVASPPGVTNRLFVVEKAGTVRMVNLDTMTSSVFMNLSTYLSGGTVNAPLQSGGECGLLSIAFHPNYNQNGYFYLFYSLNIGGTSSPLYQRVARFRATGTAGSYNSATAANANTQSPLITQRDQASNHNGGDLAFGPDGYLYISVGDEGDSGDGRDNARRISKDFFGAILRIDVDSKSTSLAPQAHDESSTTTVGDSAITAGSYKVPPDNPFVSLAQGTGTATYNGLTFNKSAIRTEIYATGLRNPWRMSFDPQTGRFYCADVGQGAYEEVNIIKKGQNYGWSWREGLHAYNSGPGGSTTPSGFNPEQPIYEYDRAEDSTGPNDSVITGTSVTGGVVYRGSRLTELFGDYIFCDYSTGHIVALRENTTTGVWTGTRLATQAGISGFGYDPRNNDTLMCDLGDGIVRRLTRSASTGTNPPALLSQTGAFSSLTNLTPNAGIVPYEPNVPFWSDYAVKTRWFSIKNTTDKIGYSATGNWTFPTGMIWVKHFDIDLTRGNATTRRKLETRFIVKTTTGIYGITYKWRADQTDADLVPETGETYAIPSSSPAQTWRFPSRTECLSCHTSAGGYALSFNTPQLNKAYTHSAQSINQIVALRDSQTSGGAASSYLSTATAPADTGGLQAYSPAADTTQSLEWRVRSYLAVNCVQCHQPGGAAPGNWDARTVTPTDLANIINGTLANDGGDPLNKFIVFGDTAHSVLLKRQQGSGFNRMPPLGTLERDLVNEGIVTDWINATPARKTFAQWQTDNFGSTTATNAAANFDADGDGRTNRMEFLTGTNPTSPTSAWTYGQMSVSGAEVHFQFTQPANRAALVEVSADLVTWQRWDVAGNAPSYPAAAQQRVITVPVSSSMRFFRVSFLEP